MGTLFNSRKLSETLIHRNVVILSEGYRNSLNEVRFTLEFDFGAEGKWANRVIIPAAVNDFSIARALSTYQDNLYEQINVLEDIEHWVAGGAQGTFSHFLEQDRPLFFYGSIRKNTLVVQIFGEGMYDLEIHWDMNRNPPINPLTQKLEELRSAFGEHLRAIEAIPLSQLMKGEAA